MYSREEKLIAIELYIKYNKHVAPVIRELGYPDRKMLPLWYKDYINNGSTVIEKINRKPKYLEVQRNTAVKYYLDHGKNISDTIRHLGYPCRNVLSNWINEDIPNYITSCLKGSTLIRYSQDEKENAVIDLSTRNGSAKEVASKYSATKCSIYKWRKKFLSKEGLAIMGDRKSIKDVESTHDKNEVIELKKEIDKLRLKKDILEEAITLIKKDMGIDIDCLSNKEKSIIINALKENYSLNILLRTLNIPKSSYFYQRNLLSKKDKYYEIRLKIKDLFNKNYESYGYRRINSELKKLDIIISEKVVRRLMKEENLFVINIKKKKFSSYLGEISPSVENIVNRDFSESSPNTKMLTDITEFGIPAGKVYLSPLIDCFDGMVTSWTISTSPNAELVNTMLVNYINTLNDDERPLIHSDRGAHYRWPEWISIMNGANLTRSMSKKGCSPDNSACEGFLGRLKNEMFYKRNWSKVTIDGFIRQLNNYIHWYNTDRIKISLGGMSPSE